MEECADKFMAEHIKKEEIELQRSFIDKIKEINLKRTHPFKAFTQTYGCQQNENDTERIRGMLKEAGFEFCDSEETADLVIYNTCAVRENAEQKVFGRLGILKHMKETRPDLLIGIC